MPRGSLPAVASAVARSGGGHRGSGFRDALDAVPKRPLRMKRVDQLALLFANRMGHDLEVVELPRAGPSGGTMTMVLHVSEVPGAGEPRSPQPRVEVAGAEPVRQARSQRAVLEHTHGRDAELTSHLDEQWGDPRLVVDVMVGVDVRHREARFPAAQDLGAQLAEHGTALARPEPRRATRAAPVDEPAVVVAEAATGAHGRRQRLALGEDEMGSHVSEQAALARKAAGVVEPGHVRHHRRARYETLLERPDDRAVDAQAAAEVVGVDDHGRGAP